ncbi:hypothetical protein H4R35_003936 [Dimargaris xerosporica]|nr:hypothetical protein H4R35_003936 [Dimargaris xerosporica]
MKAFAAAALLLAIASPLFAQPSQDASALQPVDDDMADTSSHDPYPHACRDGTMRCDPRNSSVFYVCNFGQPVKFNCGPGTACKQNGDYVYCGWP